ncbi:flagellar export chaperone FlgN [bacterium]|nr:flagellar export chaperone FlgN [bacterium]
MTDKQVNYNQLISMLIIEKEKYTLLMSILQDKQTAIIENNLEKLQDSMILEQDQYQEIAEMATKRDTLSHDIAATLNIRDRRITLTKIIARTPKKYAETLNNLKIDLKKIFKDIEYLNRESARLLEFAIFNIHDLVGRIMGFSDKKAPVYNLIGKVETVQHQSNIFNMKI